MMNPPRNLAAIVKDSATVILSWEPPIDTAPGLRSYIVTAQWMEGRRVRSVIGTKTLAAVVDLPADTDILFSLAAEDVNHVIGPAAIITARTLPATDAALVRWPGSIPRSAFAGIYHIQSTLGTRRVICYTAGGFRLKVFDSGAETADVVIPDFGYGDYTAISSVTLVEHGRVIFSLALTGGLGIAYAECVLGDQLQLLSVRRYGDARTVLADSMRTSSGGFVGSSTQSDDATTFTPYRIVYRSAGGVWSGIDFPSPFGDTRGASTALIQHPADGAVWMFSTCDSLEKIACSRFIEIGGTLGLESSYDVLVPTSGPLYPPPHMELPPIRAAVDPVAKTIVLGYLRNEANFPNWGSIRLDQPNAGWPGQSPAGTFELDQTLVARLAFVEFLTVIPPYAFNANGKRWLPETEHLYERISPWGDFECAAGRLRLLSTPTNPQDISGNTIIESIYDGMSWTDRVVGIVPWQRISPIEVIGGVGVYEGTDGEIKLLGSGETPPTPPIPVEVVPSWVEIHPKKSVQFSANQPVRWSLSTPYGSISENGLYLAPGANRDKVVTVTATSQADPSNQATATVRIRRW